MLKRFTDIAVSSLVLIFFSPVIIAAAIAVAITMGRPVIFTQERPGQHGKPFIIYKFRTMSNGRKKDGGYLPDSERVTKLGRILRSTSIDELPQLLNVLKGDMSLVGPRPLLQQFIDLCNSEEAKRLTVRPGITGLAQVNGRNSLSYKQRFEHDLFYVNNQSFRLDMQILYKTIFKVLQCESVIPCGSDMTACNRDDMVIKAELVEPYIEQDRLLADIEANLSAANLVDSVEEEELGPKRYTSTG